MKDRKKMKSGMMWLLLSMSLAIAMVFVQSPGWAVTCPVPNDATDSDSDGFTDYEECNGITLYDGTCMCGSVNCPLPPVGCTSTRTDRLDPNKKDLFVIFIRKTPSNIPVDLDPLAYVKGLPINVHLITETQASNNADYTLDRIVSPGSANKQKAVRVSESLITTPDPEIVGISFEGTPKSRDDALVYTAKIENHIETVCNCSGSIGPTWCTGCCDSTGACGVALFHKYIKQIVAHEIGHMIGPLAPVSLRDKERYGGYHYKSGTNVIMDQSVYYTVKGSIVTFYVGTTWTSLDIAGIKLY